MTKEGLRAKRKKPKSAFLLDDLTAPVHAGLAIDMVAAHGFAGVLVFDPVDAIQRVVGTAHIALRFGRFLLWYSHGTYPLSVTNVLDTGKGPVLQAKSAISPLSP